MLDKHDLLLAASIVIGGTLYLCEVAYKAHQSQQPPIVVDLNEDGRSDLVIKSGIFLPKNYGFIQREDGTYISLRYARIVEEEQINVLTDVETKGAELDSIAQRYETLEQKVKETN